MDISNKIGFVYEEDFKKTVKTRKILVKPSVISKFFLHASSSPMTEVAGLLIGRLEGTSLVIIDVYNCKKKGSSVNVELDTEEISEVASRLDKGLYIIGWAHSHPGHTVFMSGQDVLTHTDFQNLLSDSIAMVLDLFTRGRIEFNFFRIVNGKAQEIEYDFLVRRNEAL